MIYIPDEPCKKCGGATRLKWIERERKRYNDLGSFLSRECMRCGFTTYTDSADSIENMMRGNPEYEIIKKSEEPI